MALDLNSQAMPHSFCLNRKSARYEVFSGTVHLLLEQEHGARENNGVKKWGGAVEDYQRIHDWFDESKKIIAGQIMPLVRCSRKRG
jgi:hypothetical protein